MSRQSGLRFQCRAILFDLDGVLVDSTAGIEKVWTQWARQHGLDPEDVIRAAHGRKTGDTLALLAPSLDPDKEISALAAAELGELDATRAVPGAVDLIRGLGRSQWAVVTSGVNEIAQARLRHVGLPVPEVLVTADMVRAGKPSPEGYLMASKALGVSISECIVVEDSAPGIEAAHAAGMRSIGVTTTHEKYALRKADAIVGGLEEICTVVAADGSVCITIGRR